MGIPTLISTHTASDSSSVDITSGIDSTYDEYMFVLTDVGPATDNVFLTFDGSTNGGTGYGLTKTTTYFRSIHNEDGSYTEAAYEASSDQAQTTTPQYITGEAGNAADESSAGILHLFNPSSTTYVKHFYSTMQVYHYQDYSYQAFAAGYFNTTTAIDAVQIKFTSGNLDAVVQLYGIA